MIVLYTTKICPKCAVIKSKLDSKKIEYSLIDDEEVLASKGYDQVPVLEIDNKVIKSMIEINNIVNQL